MKKIITYGTFDLLHYGHIKLLQRAKELGDHLTVGVSSDSFNLLKNKKSAMNLEERIKILKELKCVDEIIVEDNWDQKATDIKDNNVDIFVIGDDWAGKFDFLPCEVVYLKRTTGISSTLMKKILKK